MSCLCLIAPLDVSNSLRVRSCQNPIHLPLNLPRQCLACDRDSAVFDEEADRDQLISLPSMAAICALRAKKSLFSSGSLYGDGPGKDDGRFYTKPPSPRRIIQSCVRASSQVQIYSFVHCLTCSFTHLSNLPFAHFFTYPCIRPTVIKQLPRARCSAWSWG